MKTLQVPIVRKIGKKKKQQKYRLKIMPEINKGYCKDNNMSFVVKCTSKWFKVHKNIFWANNKIKLKIMIMITNVKQIILNNWFSNSCFKNYKSNKRICKILKLRVFQMTNSGLLKFCKLDFLKTDNLL